MLNPGLYEQVINNEIDSKLSEISAARQATSPIDKAEASKVLTQYLTDVVQKGLDNLIDKGGKLSDQVELSNRIIETIRQMTEESEFAAWSVDEKAQQLFALLGE
ncbi:MAG: hypothetical protein GXY99_04675, partial [Clostridiaceae bacterium]|nr:hypothetical protein [Clostridiaceae bacterium]